jgi:hypothetical protein
MSNCYFCTLDDFQEIMKIHQSRFHVHDVEKTPAYYARFPTMMRSILQGLKPDHKVIGYKHDGHDKMTAYAIVWLPQKMPWYAVKMAEVIKPKESDFNISITAWIAIADELARLGELENKLQFFIACTLKMTLGLKRFTKTFKGTSRVMNDYNFLLFSIVGSDGKLNGPIEELLLSNYILPKVHNVAIMEISMTEKCRLEHFADKIGFKNSDMSKFVVND